MSTDKSYVSGFRLGREYLDKLEAIRETRGHNSMAATIRFLIERDFAATEEARRVRATYFEKENKP